MATALPLTDLPRALRNAGYDSPRYRALYDRAVDGAYEAEKAASGRWTFRPDNLDAIAKALGLSLAEPAQAA